MSSYSEDEDCFVNRGRSRYRSPSPVYDRERRHRRPHSADRNGKESHHRQDDRRSHHSSSSRSCARKERERRRHSSHEHRDRDRFHRDEPRPRSTSRLQSPSPPCTSTSSYASPECHLILKPKKEGDVIESMETAFTDGPLDILKQCVHDGQKVMVWIRNHKGIRGICTGFVLAFDKFWNLVMQDVDEVYQKARYPKTPFLQSVQQSQKFPEAASLKKKKKSAEKKAKVVKMDVEISESARQEARERRKKRKEEEKKRRAQEKAIICKRNVKKLFVRGDNVVLIRVCE